MKFHFLKKPKKAAFQKEARFNPHRYWLSFVMFFVSILIIELLAFSWYFLFVTKKLDAPVTPTLETNAAKIRSMKKTLDNTEAALSARVQPQP